MKASIFLDIVQKYLPRIAKIVETFNGKRTPPTYLHETMFRTEYSVDQTYSTSNVDTTRVTADVVALDSALPIKRRDSVRSMGGTLPCVGMKLVLSTKQINDINIMRARGQVSDEVIKKVMDDPIRCVNGMRETIEALALEGISNGYIGVRDPERVRAGELIRIDYGYPAANQFGVIIPWGKEGARPISDIARVLSVARATTTIMLDKTAYNLLRQSREGRELYASFSGMVSLPDSVLPVPTPSKFDEAFKDEYGVDFLVVDRAVVAERDGVRTTYNPWNQDKIIFLPDRSNVGAIVYGTHPEETADIAGVVKEKPLPYALLRKYATNDPYQEVTDIKGIVAPIVENVDTIFSLDITEAKELNTVKEAADSSDTKVTIGEGTYAKAEVIKALSGITGKRIVHNTSDAKILDLVNALSHEQEAQLMEAIKAHTA